MTGVSAARIVVPAQPGADDAAALATRLRDLPVDQPLAIDAGAVEAMSTPYVIVLVSALVSRADLHPPAKVTAVTPAFTDAFEALGFFCEMMRMEFAT